MIFKPNIYEIENDLYNLSIESEKEMGIFHILILFNPLYLRRIIV